MGFEGIEFVELENYDKVTDPMVNAKYIKEHCAEIGLDVIAYTVGASFTDEDFEPQFEKLKSQIDLAKAMGAPVLRHDVCYKLPEGMSWEDAIELMAPRIRRVTEYAASLGIKTCTENHGYIFQSPERVEKLIKAVDHENYGWLCDMGNFLCADADPLTSVKIAAPYTFYAHAKDFLYKSAEVKRPKGFFRTAGENHLRGTVLGHGVVPVDKCVKALKEAGYDGWLSIEFEGMEENIPALEAGLEYLRSVI
jgi:sugar phosphate isomerase/epimerase